MNLCCALVLCLGVVGIVYPVCKSCVTTQKPVSQSLLSVCWETLPSILLYAAVKPTQQTKQNLATLSFYMLLTDQLMKQATQPNCGSLGRQGTAPIGAPTAVVIDLLIAGSRQGVLVF